MRDAWTEQFVNRYVDLRSPEPLAVLTLQTIILKYDIAQIECKHASVRRLVHTRSTQTHTVDFRPCQANGCRNRCVPRALPD